LINGLIRNNFGANQKDYKISEKNLLHLVVVKLKQNL